MIESPYALDKSQKILDFLSDYYKATFFQFFVLLIIPAIVYVMAGFPLGAYKGVKFWVLLPIILLGITIAYTVVGIIIRGG